MPFDFSCVHCGKHLTQDQILFDMAQLLLQDKEKSFHYLRFRLTEAELKKLYSDGEEVPGHAKRKKISLSLSAVVSYMESEHNMQGMSLGWLNMEEIDYFLQYRTLPYVDIPEEAEKEQGDPEEDASEHKDDQQRIEKLKKAHNEKLRPFEEIVTRQSEDQASLDRTMRLGNLAADLESLRRYFGKDTGMLQCFLELEEEKTGMNDTLISGWRIYPQLVSGKPGKPMLFLQSRLCPECLEGIFEGAGTGRHRTVVFLGSQGTGKTSAILAATHLLRYYGSTEGDQGKIWNGIKLHEFREKLMCSPSKQMLEELRGYGRGSAPAKTDTIRVGAGKEMHKAYSSTFKLVDRMDRLTYLSLLDAPGEICKEKGSDAGRIDEEMIEEHFQVVLTSDAYVLCFEHPKGLDDRKKRDMKKRKQSAGTENESELEEEQSSMGRRDMVREWADKIQDKRVRMHADRGEKVGYIPMLLLFTKCPELETEDSKDERQDPKAKNDFYMFPTERNAIQRVDEFKELMKRFSEHTTLRDAFCAQLRCSPYGFQSASEDDRLTLTDLESGKAPAPQNVEKLLEWILAVTGSIPVDLNEFGVGRDSYLVPPENRELSAYEKYLLCGGKPVSHEGLHMLLNWGKERPYMPVVKVAALRARLFDNLKPYDRDLIRKRKDPTEMRRYWKLKKREHKNAEQKFCTRKEV